MAPVLPPTQSSRLPSPPLESSDEFKEFVKMVRVLRMSNKADSRSSPSSSPNKIATTSINRTNFRFTVGIDDDLQMILEMDPAIVDLGGGSAYMLPTAAAAPRTLGLPPISGGYVRYSV